MSAPSHRLAGTAFTLAYAALCAVSLYLHWKLYPVTDSLYYWWLAPVDGLALLAAPLFLAAATAGFGNLLSAVNGGLELVALLYLGVMTLDAEPAREFLLAMPVALRVGLGFAAVRALRRDWSALPARGCVS